MESLRKEVGAKVRELRKARLWTQAELAGRLELSQARLSEIERGNGSFSAEHLLEIFRLFNVDASYFASAKGPTAREDQLWNALARLGAQHLVESEQVLPSERVQQVHDVLREALVLSAPSRVLTALAPVLVARADALQLHVVESQLLSLGLQQRLGWLVENTLAALDALDHPALPRAVASRYRRAGLVLSSWLRLSRDKRDGETEDVLDPSIRSAKSRALALRARSPISERWRIVSELQPQDFAVAIKAAHETN